MTIQALFTYLIALQFLVIAVHDLVEIPGWTHTAQVRAVVGRRKLWLVTVVNSIFPALAVAFALYFLHRPKPWFVADYWVIYCAVTVASAVAMWYIPYILGGTEEQRRDYSRMYAGTRQLLPARGENPRPNLLHVCFHVLFTVNVLLALVLRFGRP
jgi:hypothetical protein